MSGKEYVLFGLGNPLLDIQANTGTDVLEKYGLKANDAILAEDKHKPIYDELMTKYDAKFLAGGAAQNAMRGAQYVLPPKSTVYVGCVGKDKFAEQLHAANEREGLRTEYLVDESTPTGKCGVVITGNNRSLVTDLAAANNYKLEHLKSPEIWKLVENAEFFYVGGFHLTVCVDAIKALGEHAAETNKTFVMNLSAPFLCQFFKDGMDAVTPYWDYILGNESEAAAWAEAHGLETTSVQEIAEHIAALPKANNKRERTVVFTQGAESVIVARPGKETVVYPVPKLSDDEIVDTNGAGDAFAGAFLGMLVKGESLETCVEAGTWLAQLAIKEVGPSFPYPKHGFMSSKAGIVTK
ncbi:pfkB family carbohydrate kinase [Saitoella complicata NRRL Y-17804]|nr:pfkB family carbohydrate kinase [Saitoella complicata NRRL Y-17804]ODQ56201.1 pfkB family carbohydrate kinase [Saitoella complicata NRRL Y-17804]